MAPGGRLLQVSFQSELHSHDSLTTDPVGTTKTYFTIFVLKLTFQVLFFQALTSSLSRRSGEHTYFTKLLKAQDRFIHSKISDTNSDLNNNFIDFS